MFELILVPVLMSGAAILAHIHQKPPERLSILTPKIKGREQQPTFTDTLFTDEALNGGIYGLLLGTLAIEKAVKPEIRVFAERLVQANQTIVLELTALAEKKGIPVAKILDSARQRSYQMLIYLSGSMFEEKFLTEAFSECEKKLRIFQRELNSGTDRELREFASVKIARVKTHLKTAAAFTPAFSQANSSGR